MSPLIGVLVIGLGLAFVLGTAAQRLELPPLVGYLLAGVVVGPFSPGVVIDQHLTLQLADIGVVLLMFGVGLHFKPQRPDGGQSHCGAGRGAADGGHHRAGGGRGHGVRLAAGAGPGVRPLPVGGFHRGGDARTCRTAA